MLRGGDAVKLRAITISIRKIEEINLKDSLLGARVHRGSQC